MKPTYTLAAKGYVPLNLHPTNSIRCLQCDQMHPVQTFDFHSRMHLSPMHQNLKPYAQVQPMSKINLTKLINEHEDEDIGIMSMKVDEVAKPQKKRKKALNLTVEATSIKNEINVEPSTDQYPNENYLLSRVDHQEKLYDNASLHQPLDIEKKVALNPQLYQVGKKTHNFYQNQNECFLFHNQRKQSRKYPPKKLQHNVKAYQIVPEPQQKTQVKEPIQMVKTVGFPSSVKKPKNVCKVSTISTPLKIRKSSIHTNVNTDELSQELGKEPGKKFSCPRCQGFYCHVCNSTIPPRYRTPFKTHQAQQYYQKLCYNCE